MRPLAPHLRPALIWLGFVVVASVASGCGASRTGAAAEALEAEAVVLPEGRTTVATSSVDYGDDVALDRLWDDCAGDVPGACEELYWRSPVGSGYERFSASR